MKKIDLAFVVDDDPIYVYSIKRVFQMLEACDHIMYFQNGKLAFNALTGIYEKGEDLPEVILLDLNMPIWDGWRFLDEFTKTPVKNKIEIFIVSSSMDPEDMTRAKKYEAVSNFIVKPVDKNKLAEILKNIKT